jgi:DNA gyrase subunit A
MKLRGKDNVVGMVIAEKGASLLTVCEEGYGKRTSLGDYRCQNRGGIGLINIKTTARNGKVVTLKTIRGEDELMMITANGMIIRTGLEQIRSIGRNTQGVRLIKLKAGDKLVAAEKISSDAVSDLRTKSDTNRKSESEAKKEKSKKSRKSK